MSSITQTSDGFLWFSAISHGVYRLTVFGFFPGVRLPGGSIAAWDVLADHAGGLWGIGEDVIAHLKEGVVTSHFVLEGLSAVQNISRT